MRNKQKDCQEVGIECTLFHFVEDISTTQLVHEIENIIKQEYTHIIIQKPLPPHIDEKLIAEIIPGEMDIDGLTSRSKYQPCTPLGIMTYLKACGINLDGKRVTIIGRSELVGRPLARMMLNANATVTVCHSHTKYLQDLTHFADIVVVATGHPGVFEPWMAPSAQIIVDVGINFDENGKMIGDIVKPDYRCTPVPGGVGLLTRLALLTQLEDWILC